VADGEGLGSSAGASFRCWSTIALSEVKWLEHSCMLIWASAPAVVTTRQWPASSDRITEPFIFLYFEPLVRYLLYVSALSPDLKFQTRTIISGVTNWAGSVPSRSEIQLLPRMLWEPNNSGTEHNKFSDHQSFVKSSARSNLCCRQLQSTVPEITYGHNYEIMGAGRA
jgi:hypothetical protein